MKKFIVLSSFLFIVSMLSFSQTQQAQLPYQKTELSFEQRTEDLLSRLTLQEKVDLMRYDSPAIPRMGIPAYNW